MPKIVTNKEGERSITLNKTEQNQLVTAAAILYGVEMIKPEPFNALVKFIGEGAVDPGLVPDWLKEIGDKLNKAND